MLKNVKMLFKKSSNKQITDIDRATIPTEHKKPQFNYH